MSGLMQQFVYLSDTKYRLGKKDIGEILTSSRRNNSKKHYRITHLF